MTARSLRGDEHRAEHCSSDQAIARHRVVSTTDRRVSGRGGLPPWAVKMMTRISPWRHRPPAAAAANGPGTRVSPERALTWPCGEFCAGVGAVDAPDRGRPAHQQSGTAVAGRGRPRPTIRVALMADGARGFPLDSSPRPRYSLSVGRNRREPQGRHRGGPQPPDGIRRRVPTSIHVMARTMRRRSPFPGNPHHTYPAPSARTPHAPGQTAVNRHPCLQ